MSDRPWDEKIVGEIFFFGFHITQMLLFIMFIYYIVDPINRLLGLAVIFVAVFFWFHWSARGWKWNEEMAKKAAHRFLDMEEDE